MRGSLEELRADLFRCISSEAGPSSEAACGGGSGRMPAIATWAPRAGISSTVFGVRVSPSPASGLRDSGQGSIGGGRCVGVWAPRYGRWAIKSAALGKGTSCTTRRALAKHGRKQPRRSNTVFNHGGQTRWSNTVPGQYPRSGRDGELWPNTGPGQTRRALAKHGRKTPRWSNTVFKYVGQTRWSNTVD